MRAKILVTGASGFIGTRLLPALNSLGCETHSFEGDLLKSDDLSAAFKKQPWDQVIHLAAISHVPTCDKEPAQAREVNVKGTQVLLDALLEHCPRARLTFSSSSQIYAAPAKDAAGVDLPITEEHTASPSNVYAQTKLEAEQLIYEACEKRDLRATVFRIFNHSHKSQPAAFFLPNIYHTLKRARPGETANVTVGNLDLNRDIGKVDDLIRAFVRVVEVSDKLQNFELFNVCSGTRRNLRELGLLLAERLNVKANFVVDRERLRPNEIKTIYGSFARLNKATGWFPTATTNASFIESFLAD